MNTPNIENLKKVKDFFDRGAPHYFLTMDLPFGATDRTDIQEYVLETDEAIPADCGSAGCIAGAAYMLLHPKPDDHIPLGDSWYVVGEFAYKALGLDQVDHEPTDDFFYHDLFSTELAPIGCTASQASAAIQRVIDGQHPWL